VYTATSLAAAVEGEDAADSWFVGTVVQVGPRVNLRDVRMIVAHWLRDLPETEDAYGNRVIRADDVARVAAQVATMDQRSCDPVNVGDRVIFSWASGQQVSLDGERYLLLRAAEVLAVMEAD